MQGGADTGLALRAMGAAPEGDTHWAREARTPAAGVWSRASVQGADDGPAGPSPAQPRASGPAMGLRDPLCSRFWNPRCRPTCRYRCPHTHLYRRAHTCAKPCRYGHVQMCTPGHQYRHTGSQVHTYRDTSLHTHLYTQGPTHTPAQTQANTSLEEKDAHFLV